jgi:hypothetical protein
MSTRKKPTAERLVRQLLATPRRLAARKRRRALAQRLLAQLTLVLRARARRTS